MVVTSIIEACSKKNGKVNRPSGLKVILLGCYIKFGPKSQESRICFRIGGYNTVSRWMKFSNKIIFIPKLGGMCLHQNLGRRIAGTRKLPRSCHRGIDCIKVSIS